MNQIQVKLNASLLLCLLITLASFNLLEKKSSHYKYGTVYTEVLQTRSSANDSTISSNITGTGADIRVEHAVKRYTLVFKNGEHPTNEMVFNFIRNVIPENPQPNQKIYLVEFQDQYYFLTDNLDNQSPGELIIRSEKQDPDHHTHVYKITGLKKVK